MKETLLHIQSEAREKVATVQSSAELEVLRRAYLGRSGVLPQILRSMGKLPAEERPVIGKLANETKELIEQLLAQRAADLGAREQEAQLAAERIDVTLPGRGGSIGKKHPLTLVTEEICEIFTGLGFEVVEGPEVETEWHNFIALNIPPDHPARDEQDTFYFSDDLLLRTHTSPVQIRTMESRQPPVRIIVPGRVYRRDPFDATHSPIFHQVEGLLVDEDTTFADLKGTLTAFAQKMFGAGVRTRFRPSYFPFTEPSAEVDISCIFCNGDGCGVCKQSGWIEILGSGMVHPNVLRNVGYDPEQVQGFAFGMGIDRIAILKYQVNDIRLFFENDLRFVRQFE
ncbi:MAG: phenylalanine--tRNA ligase subunit alpha [Abditibacteriales bacterium]|nr:phenylalanine--tRNA ligase subunit alpha [Abditibacteriales bacterium]MDW8365187.1 phenylalanine--tRNA ligase subunit alpha [Abditibacteriales bacterium]